MASYRVPRKGNAAKSKKQLKGKIERRTAAGKNADKAKAELKSKRKTTRALNKTAPSQKVEAKPVKSGGKKKMPPALLERFKGKANAKKDVKAPGKTPARKPAVQKGGGKTAPAGGKMKPTMKKPSAKTAYQGRKTPKGTFSKK